MKGIVSALSLEPEGDEQEGQRVRKGLGFKEEMKTHMALEVLINQVIVLP